MKTKLLAMVLLAGGSMFAQNRFSIGIGIGGYAPGYYPQYSSVQAVVPPCPGPDYTWVDGYWSPYGGRNAWVSGYWARPAYAGGYYVAPRYAQPRYDNRYYDGYRQRSRSFDRGGDHDRGRHYGQGYRRGNGNENGFRGR
jgi:WXXGXW repeat (2 copies)